MTTRSTILTPKQAREWCDAELARHERQVHQAELAYANDQYQEANATRDERVYFWSEVKQRVQRGERLQDAMYTEHRRHDGPHKLEYHHGQPVVGPDLDFWKLA